MYKKFKKKSINTQSDFPSVEWKRPGHTAESRNRQVTWLRQADRSEKRPSCHGLFSCSGRGHYWHCTVQISPLFLTTWTWFLSTPCWWQQFTTTAQMPAFLLHVDRSIYDAAHQWGKLREDAVKTPRLSLETSLVLHQLKQIDGRLSCTLGRRGRGAVRWGPLTGTHGSWENEPYLRFLWIFHSIYQCYALQR